MAIGFYDHDIFLKPKSLLFNLELMKIARYFNNKKENVTLIQNLKDIDNFEKVFIFRDIPKKNINPSNLKDAKLNQIIFFPDKNIEYYGLIYNGGVYIPMKEEYEKQTPLIQIYAPYLKEKIKSGELTILQVQKLMDAHFLRLRAGDYELPLENLERKSRLFIYDREIEKVNNWEEKLKYARENLLIPDKRLKIQIPNGFKTTSFENTKKLLCIPGIASKDIWLYTKDSYPQFRTNFKEIAPLVSSRDGIKYQFGYQINPYNVNEVVKEFCLTINKYFFTKSILKGCEFIIDDACSVSPLYKILKDFQYWTSLRMGNETLKEHLIKRNKTSFDEYYTIINKTPYRSQFESLINITKNNVKEAGWYYHV